MPKYIVVKGNMGNDLGIPFTQAEFHADMARRFGGDDSVLGAGEFSFYYDERNEVYHLTCYGKSVSLDINSRGYEDALALKYSLFNDITEVICH